MHEGKKLITITSGGPLAELNYITGPVLHPWYVDMAVVMQLVTNGKIVYEVNPANRSERVKLTHKNVRLTNFGAKEQAPKKQEVKKPEPVKAVEPKVEEVKPEPVKVEEPKKEEHKKHSTSDFKKK